MPEALRKPEFLIQWSWVAIPFIIAGAVLFAISKRAKAETAIPKLLLTIGGVLILLGASAWVAKHYDVDLGRYRMILYSVALLLMIRFRPQGLLSINEIWDRSIWNGALVWLKAITRSGGAS